MTFPNSFWYIVKDFVIKTLISRRNSNHSGHSHKNNIFCLACTCPKITVNAVVETNEIEAAVNWTQLNPEPSCPSVPVGNNSTSARLSVGKHVVTYKYRAPPFWPKLEMECHVVVIVKGRIC